MKPSSISLHSLLLLLLLGVVSSERILFIHVMASYSHRVQTYPLAQALALQGHEVSYVSPFHPKQPNPNISELVPKSLSDQIDKFNSDYDITIRVRNEMEPMHRTLFDFAHETCEVLYSSPEFQEWLKLNQTFDLAIIDNCFAECGLGLAHHLGVRRNIIFSTVVPLPHEYDQFGVLPQSSAIPEFDNNPFTTPMGFFERLSNSMTPLVWRWKHYFYSWRMDKLIRKYFDDNPEMPMPFVGELIRNVSLIFYTGDVVTDYPRAVAPLFVNVAGTHCKDSEKALPKEMEAFINSTEIGRANDGFIYISLGSLVISSNLPEHIKQTFFSVMRSFPSVKFLWKWNGDVPKDIPENLYLSKWFPQVDVLGHPKLRGFITQSGRPSTLEALHLGVPMISFPILGDQDLNANRMAEMGATIKLEIGAFTFQELRGAVEKVVFDPRIKQRMTKLQQLFRDRPMTPVQTGVWWIDYVLRHEDTSHLRPTGNEQYWFVRRQVDVWAFLSIGLFLVIVGALVLSRKLFNAILPSSVEASTKLKKS